MSARLDRGGAVGGVEHLGDGDGAPVYTRALPPFPSAG